MNLNGIIRRLVETFDSKSNITVNPDVKQMIKEEPPEDHRHYTKKPDPEAVHIKEEQDKVCASLRGDQLISKEEKDAIKFPQSATTINDEDDKHQSLVQQLYQDNIEGRELPVENDGQDVKQMIKEEAPKDRRHYAIKSDPEAVHIKEEQQEVCTSLGGDQLNSKEERNAIKLSKTAILIKSGDDKHQSVVQHLYQDQIKADVKQMIQDKPPEDHKHYTKKPDPEAVHIKEEQEQNCTSLGGDQLSSTEEKDAIMFLKPVTPIKSEDDKHQSVVQHHYQDHIKGVQQMIQGEPPEDHRHYTKKPDPEAVHIKEEQEEICTSLGGDQLSSEEIYTLKFPKTATPTKSKVDKRSSVVQQLCQDHITGRETPDENDGEESMSIRDHVDRSISSGTEDVNQSMFGPKNLLASRMKRKDRGFPRKKPKAHKSHGNLAKRFSGSSEFSQQLDQNLQKDMVPSEMCSSSIRTENIPLCCDLCGKSFKNKVTLKRHMVVHTEEKPFCCDLCGKRLRCPCVLKTHRRIHTGERPFCCDICGQSFKQPVHLKMHMMIHTGEKPFACDQCGHRCSDKTRLKFHMRIHTGEKPFSCDICGHKFHTTQQLKTHILIHKDKSVLCDLCGQKFRDKSRLKSHMGVHTGDRPFGCELCGKRYSNKGNLKRHMLTHTGHKPFFCDVCEKRFYDKGSLNAHMVIHTGITPFLLRPVWEESWVQRTFKQTHEAPCKKKKQLLCMSRVTM